MNHVNAIRCNDEYQCSHCGKSWDIHEEAPDCKMTLVELPKTKTVDYFGLQLTVPLFINFIATDSDGEVYGYENKPYDDVYWEPDGDNDLDYYIIATVNLHGLDWRETLRKC